MPCNISLVNSSNHNNSCDGYITARRITLIVFLDPLFMHQSNMLVVLTSVEMAETDSI